jgi:hypothetical protein
MLLFIGSPDERGNIMKYELFLCFCALVFGFAFTAAMITARPGVAQEL